MQVRPATPADLDAVREVARLQGDHFVGTTRPDSVDHELAHGRLVVAAERGTVLGFGGVFEREGVSYLADLFLRPDRLGQGLGSAILHELFPEPGDRFTYSSSDPRALPLYVRFGMEPLAPLLYLAGAAVESARLPDPGVSLSEGSLDEIIEMDRRAFGRQRPQDHAFLPRLGALPLVALEGRTPVGYGYVRPVLAPGGPMALLNPTGSGSPEGLARTTFALLRHAVTLAPKAAVAVLGSHPGLRDLLVAGFRVEDRDTFMSSKPGLLDGTRYGPSPVLG